MRIISFSVSHLLFSSSVVAMSTSRLTGVCMTSNSYQGRSLEDHDCPFFGDSLQRRRVIRLWPGNCRRCMAWHREPTVSSVRIYRIIISLGRYCWDLCKNWTQQVCQQFVSLLYSLLLWNVRPPRHMCGEVVYKDLCWVNGVMCHNASDAIKPTPSIVAWVQPKSRTMCVKLVGKIQRACHHSRSTSSRAWPASSWSQRVAKRLARRTVIWFPGMATTLFTRCFVGWESRLTIKPTLFVPFRFLPLTICFGWPPCLHHCTTGKGDECPSEGHHCSLRKSNERSVPERDSVVTSSRWRPNTKGRCILLWTHQKLSRSTQRMDPTLDIDLNVENTVTFFLLFNVISFVSGFCWRGDTQHWPSIFGVRLHIAHSTNNYQSSLSASLSRLSWLVLYDCSLVRKLWSNTRQRTQKGEKDLRTTLISRVYKVYWEKQFGRAIHRMLRILQLYLNFMKFVSLDKSWSFRTKISGSDSQSAGPESTSDIEL